MENRPPSQPDAPSPSMLFLLLAFLPMVLIAATFPSEVQHSDGTRWKWVLYGVNPVISILASIKVFDRPGWESVSKIALGFLVGLGIAVLNGFLGVFAGCVCMVTQKGSWP
jgi:hypothetical protein